MNEVQKIAKDTNEEMGQLAIKVYTGEIKNVDHEIEKIIMGACAKYAHSKIPEYSDISKHKTELGKEFPRDSYIEQDGWNSAITEITSRIDQDLNSLQNE